MTALDLLRNAKNSSYDLPLGLSHSCWWFVPQNDRTLNQPSTAAEASEEMTRGRTRNVVVVETKGPQTSGNHWLTGKHDDSIRSSACATSAVKFTQTDAKKCHTSSNLLHGWHSFRLCDGWLTSCFQTRRVWSGVVNTLMRRSWRVLLGTGWA